MKITVVGTGYVGLVTGACFAETGLDVTCVDINEEKIETLRKGTCPIYEPGLEEILERTIEKDRLHFTTYIAESLIDSEVVFIAVGTPPDEDGSADLKHVLNVAKDIGKYMQNYMLIATKSTVPVGTSEKVRQTIQAELDKRDESYEFDVASNPEFLKQGAAVSDFLRPDRIIIGVDSPRAEKIMKRLYKPFVLNGHPVIFMDIASAELTKYAANSMLATRISFMNEIANLCDLMGANVEKIREGIGSDPRIGEKFLYAGVGYGGSCFPKDVKALIRTAKQHDYDLQILKAVESVNEKQKLVFYHTVKEYFDGDLEGRNIAIWGLSFKPETDDLREAPSLVLIDKFKQAGCNIKGYDPQAMENAKKVFIGDKIEYTEDPYEALIDAECLLILTEWSEFRLPNFKVMKKLMKNLIIMDGRNILDPEEVREHGFEYIGIGINN